MAAIFDPAEMLKKVAPAAKIKRMLKANLTLKKTALSFLNDTGFIDKNAVADVALKVVDSYQKRAAQATADEDFQASAGQAVEKEIVADPALLIQRVQNAVIYQIHDEIKTKYDGQQARWLPSSADEPRPEHQLNYGKIYVVGEGIDGVEPGDDYGCQCGVELLEQDELNLGD